MFTLILLALTPAQASAYYFVDEGTRALGRAGAFVAGASDLSAQYYNPAALIHLTGPQVYFDYSLVNQGVAFTRVDDNADGTTTRYPTIHNESGPMTVPQFGIGSKLGLKNAYFAFGLYPPFAPKMAYPEDGAQRYSLIESVLWQTYAGPSAALRVTPWLTVGAGFVWTLVRADETLDMMLCQDEEPFDGEITRCPADADPAENDVGISLKMWDPARFTWNAGLLVEPTDWIQIGASVTPLLKVHGTGSLSSTFGPDHWTMSNGLDLFSCDDPTNGCTYTDDDVKVALTMPWIFRGGIEVQPIEKLTVELAGVYQLWSATNETRVTGVNLTLTDNPDNPFLAQDVVLTDPVILPANYRNAFSVRLGGDYDVNDWLTARTGGYFEQSAVPPTTQSVALIDGNKFGYALGGTGKWKKRLGLDLAFAQTFIVKRQITDSDVRRIEVPIDMKAALDASQSGQVPPAPIIRGAVVGNGTFASTLTFLSAGLTYSWGKGAE